METSYRQHFVGRSISRREFLDSIYGSLSTDRATLKLSLCRFKYGIPGMNFDLETSILRDMDYLHKHGTTPFELADLLDAVCRLPKTPNRKDEYWRLQFNGIAFEYREHPCWECRCHPQLIHHPVITGETIQDLSRILRKGGEQLVILPMATYLMRTLGFFGAGEFRTPPSSYLSFLELHPEEVRGKLEILQSRRR